MVIRPTVFLGFGGPPPENLAPPRFFVGCPTADRSPLLFQRWSGIITAIALLGSIGGRGGILAAPRVTLVQRREKSHKKTPPAPYFYRKGTSKRWSSFPPPLHAAMPSGHSPVSQIKQSGSLPRRLSFVVRSKVDFEERREGRRTFLQPSFSRIRRRCRCHFDGRTKTESWVEEKVAAGASFCPCRSSAKSWSMCRNCAN